MQFIGNLSGDIINNEDTKKIISYLKDSKLKLELEYEEFGYYDDVYYIKFVINEIPKVNIKLSSAKIYFEGNDDFYILKNSENILNNEGTAKVLIELTEIIEDDLIKIKEFIDQFNSIKIL